MAEKLITVPYEESKLGNQHFISSSRVGLLFTASANTTTEFDEYDPQFLNGNTASSTGDVGFGYGAGARGRIGRAGSDKNREILVGAGWRSVNIEQQHNVTQEGGLGHYEILETISHSVASNTMSVDRMALRLRALSRIGIAPFGKDVLTSPRLNCYIYDPKERQRGAEFGYLKVYGLHLQTNRWSTSNGSTVMESVSFRADRFSKVKSIPTGLLARMQQMFPHIYSDLEQLQSFQYVTSY